MADAVEWLILDDLKDTLAGISTGGGYNFTVRNSYGWRVPDNVERPATAVVGGDVVYIDGPNDLYQKQLPFVIQAEIEAIWDTDEATSPDRLGWRFVADVVKAILVDVRRNSNATDTTVTGATVAPDWPHEPLVTIEVRGRVDFRTPRNDPTVPR